MGAVAVDPGGDLDDGVVGQVRQRALVPHVDDLESPVPSWSEAISWAAASL